MKKLVLGAALAMGISAANNASAMGGIQIDPTGNGDIGSSTFLTSLGNSFGNFLAQSALTTAGPNTTFGGTTIWAHNAIPVLGGELTFVFSISATAGLDGSALTLDQTADGAGTFDLYWDDTPDANQITGDGYADGVNIASGSITVVPPMSFSRIGLTIGPMDDTKPLVDQVPSIAGNGSAFIEIDFAPGSVDTDYVVNDLAALAIDLQADNALRLRYTTGAGNRASEEFGDGTVTPYFGADGVNDFDCGALEFCDFQSQMNTTFTFFAPPVPEPGTLALMGAALGLVGVRRRRQRAKV